MRKPYLAQLCRGLPPPCVPPPVALRRATTPLRRHLLVPKVRTCGKLALYQRSLRPLFLLQRRPIYVTLSSHQPPACQLTSFAGMIRRRPISLLLFSKIISKATWKDIGLSAKVHFAYHLPFLEKPFHFWFF